MHKININHTYKFWKHFETKTNNNLDTLICKIPNAFLKKNTIVPGIKLPIKTSLRFSFWGSKFK